MDNQRNMDMLTNLCVQMVYNLFVDDSGEREYLLDLMDMDYDSVMELFRQINIQRQVGLFKKIDGEWTYDGLE